MSRLNMLTPHDALMDRMYKHPAAKIGEAHADVSSGAARNSKRPAWTWEVHGAGAEAEGGVAAAHRIWQWRL